MTSGPMASHNNNNVRFSPYPVEHRSNASTVLKARSFCSVTRQSEQEPTCSCSFFLIHKRTHPHRSQCVATAVAAAELFESTQSID